MTLTRRSPQGGANYFKYLYYSLSSGSSHGFGKFLGNKRKPNDRGQSRLLL
jgi:hypothetical protein